MSKSLVIIGGILVAILPWMSGGSDPLGVVISVFGLLIAVFLMWRRPTELNLAATLPLRFLTFLWLGWGMLSLIWSVNRYDTELWLLYAILGVLVFAVATRLSLAEKAELLGGYVWIAVIAAVYGFYLYFTGDYDRLTSSFYWANPCAAFLLPAMFIVGWRWIELEATQRFSRSAWLRIAQTLVLGTAVWLTDSRGALLAAVVVLAVTLLSASVRRRIPYVLGIIVLSFGLSAGDAALRTHFLHQTSVAPGSRFAQAAEGESTSVQDRWNYLESTIAIWKDHPLLGTGAGTFGTVHPQYQQSVISASNDAHNIFAQTLAEQGLIGLLILLYLFVIVAIGMARGVRREPQLAVVAVAAAVLLIHFGLDIDDRYPALIALLALLAAVCYQPWRAVTVTGYRRWVVPALLLPTLILSVSFYQSSVATNHGIVYDDNHDLTSAAASYQQAHSVVAYDPDTWGAEGIDYYTLASITNGSRHYAPLALDRANQAIARDPNDSQHYFLLARVDRLDGQLASAETAYHKTLQLDPWNHPEYYVDLATLQLQRGETAAARATVQKALNLYPDSVIANRNADTTIKPAVAELLVLQAADHLQHGDKAAAAAELSRALRLDPTSQDAKQLQNAT